MHVSKDSMGWTKKIWVGNLLKYGSRQRRSAWATADNREACRRPRFFLCWWWWIRDHWRREHSTLWTKRAAVVEQLKPWRAVGVSSGDRGKKVVFPSDAGRNMGGTDRTLSSRSATRTATGEPILARTESWRCANQELHCCTHRRIGHRIPSVPSSTGTHGRTPVWTELKRSLCWSGNIMPRRACNGCSDIAHRSVFRKKRDPSEENLLAAWQQDACARCDVDLLVRADDWLQTKRRPQLPVLYFQEEQRQHFFIVGAGRLIVAMTATTTTAAACARWIVYVCSTFKPKPCWSEQ